MREICQSGSEGGVAQPRHPYPYHPRYLREAVLNGIAGQFDVRGQAHLFRQS
jgi:hypothetical protein